MRKIQTLVLFGLLVILLVLPFSNTGHWNDTGTVGVAALSDSVHEPIEIGSDGTFASTATAEGWKGNGTAGNPYIIEDLVIEVPPDDMYVADGIWIGISVTVHYVIENCTIYSSAPDAARSGIRLTGGNGTVSHCEMYNISSGVYAEGANKTMRANNIHDCDTGIVLFSTISAEVVDNIIAGPQNRSYTNGVFLAGHYQHLSHDDYIYNNTLSGCYWGIYSGGHEDHIHANCIAENTFGIHIQYHNNTLTNNTICENTELGIKLGLHAADTQIHYNILFNNSQHAEDDGSDNIWDDGESLGNYWDDAFTRAPYNIQGDANSIDRYPRLYERDPPEIEDVGELTFVQGDPEANITWDAHDATPSHYWVFLNGSVFISESWNGADIFVNVSTLDTGTYNMTLKLLDRNGNSASDQVLLHIVAPPQEPLDPTILLVLGGAGAAVVILAVVLVKRR